MMRTKRTALLFALALLSLFPAHPRCAQAGSETLPAAAAFLEAYAAMELNLFDALIPNMKENPATYMDAIYLNDALRIKITLRSAATLWAEDATETGDEQSRNYVAGSTFENGKPVRIENTITARYDAEAGLFSVTVTEGSQLVSRTECLKTPYGFAAQQYIPANKKSGAPAFRILITLRDGDGMIGMEPKAKDPGALDPAEPYDAPMTLRDWFTLQGKRISVHSEEGATTEFEVKE